MPLLKILSAVEQVAVYLRHELIRGHWSGFLPGVDRLSEELGVSRKTVEAALRILENEGLLTSQGPRRKRSIEVRDDQQKRGLRVAILLSEKADRQLEYVIGLHYELVDSGHTVHFAPVSLVDIGNDVRKLSRLVERTAVDAWLVLAGSREVLEWFSKQPIPTFAVFGRRRGLAIAGVGPNKPPVCAEATRTLIGLGHKRIALLTRKVRRLPQPGESERAFLGELESHGIPPGPYHLPDWEETIDGFHARLEALFRVTPPTALIVDEATLFAATQQFLARRGLRVPDDVSLICTDADSSFAWCKPSISHIRWDSRPVVRRIVRWAANISMGKHDIRQTLTGAEFIHGGTIGPVARH